MTTQEIMSIAETMADKEFHNERNSAYYTYRQGVYDALMRAQLYSPQTNFEKLYKDLMTQLTGHLY